MKHKWKKFFSYYKPYRLLFITDMIFAIMGAAVTLVIPLIIRYITSTVVLQDVGIAYQIIMKLAALMVCLVLIEFISNYFIAYFGHIMGARMEYDLSLIHI